jgi:exopolysaccharide biosynthesis protein
MKKILIILLFLPMMVLSQKVKTDTTVICIPYKAAKQMALDLNRLDSLTAVHNLTVTELSQIQNKVTFQDKIISTMEQKENNYELQIEKEKEKFVIVNEENGQLKKDITNLKVKNNILNIVSGAIITGLTYIFIFK